MKKHKSDFWGRVFWGGIGFVAGFNIGKATKSSRSSLPRGQVGELDNDSDIIFVRDASPSELKFVLAFMLQLGKYLEDKPDFFKASLDKFMVIHPEAGVNLLIQRWKSLGLDDFEIPTDNRKDSNSWKGLLFSFFEGNLFKLSPPIEQTCDLSRLSSLINGIRLEYNDLATAVGSIALRESFSVKPESKPEVAKLITDALIACKPFLEDLSRTVIEEWVQQYGESALNWFMVSDIFTDAIGPSATWCKKCGYFQLIEDDDLIRLVGKRWLQPCPGCGNSNRTAVGASGGVKEYRRRLNNHRQGILGCSSCGHVPSLIPVPEGQTPLLGRCSSCGEKMKVLVHRDI